MTTGNEIGWVQLVTGVTAGVGAVLGVFNTWRGYINDRVRLRVTPLWTLHTDGGERLAVKVVNLSTFDVTVDGVGFTLAGSKDLLYLRPLMLDTGANLPVLLKPRAAFTAFAAVGTGKEVADAKAVRAYASTQCGVMRCSSRRALKIALHNLSLAGKDVL